MARFNLWEKIDERVFFKILAVLSALSILPLLLLGIILIDGISDMRDPITETTKTMSASVGEISEDMRLKNLEHEKAMYESVLASTAEMTNITRAEMHKVGEIARSGGDINESVELAEERMEGEARVLEHKLTRDMGDMAESIDTAAFMMNDRLADATQALKSSVDDMVRETANRLVILLAGMVVASFLVTILFTRIIVRPIYELTRGAEAISRGNLDYRVDIESRDEFGTLARTFNQMAEDLKEYSGQMEQKVEERTAELKHEKDITKSISNSIMDGILLLSKDLKILKANKSFLDCMGLTEEDVIGELCHKITHESDEICKAPYDTCPALEVLETGEPAIEVHIHMDRAGNKRFVEVTAYPVKNEKDEIDGFVHVSKDITEKKRLEEGVKESETKYRRLFAGNPSALYVIDKKGNFLEVNQKFAEVTGYKIDDLRGKNLEDLFSKKDKAKVMHYHRKKTTHKDLPFECEIPLVKKDGKTITVNIRANVDTGGEFSVGSLDDITERKRMEHQIKEYTEQLVQKVDERTREVKLERDKLGESARKLKRSNELKDLFIDIMRHDLLSQIGVIENSSELVLDMTSDCELKDLTSIINRSAGRLVELIEDASKYAALEEVRDIESEKFDITDVLTEVIETNDHLAKEKNITVDFRPDTTCIFTASPLMKDVFSNILSNAIKYSPENTKVEIEIQKGPPCVVAVKDRGFGIPDEEKDNIFKRFTRLSKKGIQGSGLGLAIVYRIVDLHNGRVWVEDNPGGGSIFKVELPT